MSKIVVTDYEMFEEVKYGCGDWNIVEDGDWSQDYKYQNKDVVVLNKETGKFYKYSVSRSGSDFTEWYYEYENGKFPVLYEVVPVEKQIVVTEWQLVQE